MKQEEHFENNMQKTSKKLIKVRLMKPIVEIILVNLNYNPSALY